MKIKRSLIAGFIFLALAFVFYQTNRGKGKNDPNAQVILYSSQNCPHCLKVKDWLKENQMVKSASGLLEKDISLFRAERELQEKAKECQVPSEEGISLPFLYDHGQCIIGDQPIIDFLSEKYRQ